MNATWYTILAIVNIPLYYFWWKLIFNDWYTFWEAIKYWFQPDLWSWVKGEYAEDWAAETKLGIFSILCVGSVIGESYLLSKYIL